ncbi:MAG: helix-turn-helix domain-containing protein [Oscillospiraceae bacterium]|nr:helix-turn-helix domain-containing protein [Oscillospiraceae bacterium]
MQQDELELIAIDRGKTNLRTDPSNYQIFIKDDLKDINPLSVGKASIAPGYRAVTYSKNCVHLFYSCEGGGSFRLGDERHRVKTGDFFILPVGTETVLQADSKTGWTYRWIGLSGTLSHDFMRFPAVFSLPADFTATLYDPDQPERNLSSRLAGELFLIHAKMQEPKELEQDYVQKVINRINTSYMEKLSVSDMANELGLDRSHLSRLFKARMGMSMQEYILQFRIAEAKRYLVRGSSVSDTAMLCGFGDRVHFSRLFLRETGHRPAEWKKALEQQPHNRPR